MAEGWRKLKPIEGPIRWEGDSSLAMRRKGKKERRVKSRQSYPGENEEAKVNQVERRKGKDGAICENHEAGNSAKHSYFIIMTRT